RVAALPFDKALAEFRAVVEKLEAGNLPLEDSIALFEQGVLLQRRCERMLSWPSCASSAWSNPPAAKCERSTCLSATGTSRRSRNCLSRGAGRWVRCGRDA